MRRPALLMALAALFATPPAAAEGEESAGTGDAEGAEGAESAVLFARGGALWRLEAGGEPVKVTDIDAGAQAVSRLEVAPNGRAALTIVAGRPVWVDLQEGRGVRLPCGGKARLAATGRAVLCVGKGGAPALYRVTAPRAKKVFRGVPATEIDLMAGGEALAVVGSRGIWSVPVRDPSQRRLIAPHVPETVSVAPDGHRAVGVYAKDGIRTLYVFRLDGKAARRQLLLAAEPVAWSADSAWIAAQADRQACVIRATGGQYKCWKGFRALGVGTGLGSVLLERGGNVYRAPLTGTRAARPTLLIEDAEAAAWVP